MPALVKSSVGSLCGTSEELRITRWPRSSKNFRNVRRTSLPAQSVRLKTSSIETNHYRRRVQEPQRRAAEPNSCANVHLTSFFHLRIASGKSNTPQQILETGIAPQIVHARVYRKVNKPVRVFLVGFLQVFQGPVIFSQADVDSSEEVGRNVFVLCEFCQIIENLQCFFRPSRLSIRMR